MRTKSARLALLLVLAPILTACRTTAGGETRIALCDQFRPIRWSSQDTPESVTQIKQHNAVGASICRWKP